MFSRISFVACAAIAALGWAGAGRAGELLVRVSGMAEPLGRVGCSLYGSGDGFPMDNAKANSVWLAADAAGVTCRFADVPAGRYAVAVGHDVNGNQRVDTNFVGMPTEQWGVSRNARPRLRAPTFEEAAFDIGSGSTVIDIKVGK
jgi:uncharacterized protein (DUF2141 family)